MQLRKIIKSANAKYKNLDVRGLCFDSRKIKKGDIFLQLKEKRIQEINILKKLF